jgi:hypothetical protein
MDIFPYILNNNNNITIFTSISNKQTNKQTNKFSFDCIELYLSLLKRGKREGVPYTCTRTKIFKFLSAILSDVDILIEKMPKRTKRNN